MRAKVLCAMIVLVGLIIVAAGCLSPNARPQFPTTSLSPNGNHDAVLERFIAADYNATALNVTISKWQVKWINGTALIVNAEGKQTGTNNTVSISKTVKRSASINASTATVNAYDLTNYTRAANANATAALYAKAVGKNATVFRAYEKTTASSSSLNIARVMQFDDIIAISDTTIAQTPAPSPTPTPTAVPQSPTANPTAVPTEVPAQPTPQPTESPSASPTPLLQRFVPWLYPYLPKSLTGA
jgi:hypothetical protein